MGKQHQKSCQVKENGNFHPSNNEFIQKPAEVLLISASSPDPYSTIIVDPRTGVSTWSFKGSELQGAATASVAPLGNNGEHIIVATKSRVLHCLAIHNKDRFHCKSTLSGVVSCLTTSQDGSLLFAAIDTKIHCWLLTTGELLTVIDAHYQSISRLVLSSDESLLVSTSVDGAVHVYLVSELVSIQHERNVKPIRKWQSHTLSIKDLAVGHGNDARIATCGIDHVAVIHSISLDVPLVKISADRPLTSCALDPAESRLFVGSDLGNIAQINLYAIGSRSELLIQTTAENNESIPVFNGHSDEITALTVNGDGSLLASGDNTGKYCLWEINSRQCLKISTMRGPISTLRFIPNWPTFSSIEYKTMWRPMFDLQRNPTSGAKVQLSFQTKEVALEKWRLLSDKILQEKELKISVQKGLKVKNALQNGADASEAPEEKVEKKKVMRNDNKVSSSRASTNLSLEEKIEQLVAENKRLRKINAELYSFSAKHILEGE